MTVPRLLRGSSERFADRTAFVVDDDRETYAELHRRSRDFARGLIALGIRPGERVAIIMHNSLDAVHALFGCSLAGAVAVTVNTRLAPPELLHIVTDSGARAAFVGDHAAGYVDLLGRVRSALAPVGAAPDLEHRFFFGAEAEGFRDRAAFEALAESVPVELADARGEEVLPESTYLMLYTSGTTSTPKGCLLPHRSIVQTGLRVGRDRFGLTPGDVMWNALPLFHVSAQAPLTGVLDAGATYVSMLHHEVHSSLELIRREGATVLYPAYPALTQPLLNEAGDIASAFADVRCVLTVGPPELLRKYQNQLPAATKHISCYGSTELGGVAVMGRLDDPDDLRATAGVPLPGLELQIRDLETGAELPAGATGVIWMRGYNLFRGYHNDPVKSAAAFDDDGWFNTEDLGSVDDGGYLTFMGREKDMLKVGGENVACMEIEAVLMGHPDVAVAAVVGLADEKYDEVPVAFVELKPGATVTPECLIEHCRAHLAAFKVPRQVRTIVDWPMSTTKIQKFRLRELLVQA